MKVGIIGLPNVGKSTLFNSLSSAKAQSANFPFCTIEPNLGKVLVPDNRINELVKLVNPEKTIQTTIEIVDIAGLVKGASKGEGLGNQFLANIRECNALVHVLRCFDNPNIIHVEDRVNPVKDKEIIDLELQLKDLETVEKRIEKVTKKSKSGDKELLIELDLLKSIRTQLEQNKPVRPLFDTLDPKLVKLLASYQLLTSMPVIYICNVDENALNDNNEYVNSVKKIASEEQANLLVLAIEIEAEIAELETYEDKQEFLTELGLKEPGVSQLIKASYKTLNLHTFFTVGKKEIRAWTIPIGHTAPQAAGTIHTDFERGFIKAEVISYNDFVEYKSEAKAREFGKLRMEGKEYIVKDGDIMNFKFNV